MNDGGSPAGGEVGARRVLPIIEETLHVEARTVATGGFRLVKSVSTSDETVDVPLQSSEFDVQREEIGRMLTGDVPPPVRTEGDTTVYPVVKEVLVTEKRLLLVAEVRVRRISVTHHEQHTAALRKEEIVIERMDDAPRPSAKQPSTKPPSQATPAQRARSSTMSSVLVGLFDTKTEADGARSQLLAAGFRADAVTMHPGDSGLTTSPAGTSTTTTTGTRHEEEGGLMRFIHSLFGDDDGDATRAGHTDTYGEAFRRGAYGVTVHTATDDETDRAEAILNQCGAIDVDERSAQWRTEGWTGASASSAATSATAATAATIPAAAGTQTLKEVEEELQVGKRVVSRGGVRVFSRLTEVPVEESIRLREEHADIQRRAVDRPATEADFAAFREGEIELRNTAEEAVVSKTARVVGEVEVGTVATEREETVHGSVRRTSVEVEQIPGSGKTSVDPGSAL